MAELSISIPVHHCGFWKYIEIASLRSGCVGILALVSRLPYHGSMQHSRHAMTWCCTYVCAHVLQPTAAFTLTGLRGRVLRQAVPFSIHIRLDYVLIAHTSSPTIHGTGTRSADIFHCMDPLC